MDASTRGLFDAYLQDAEDELGEFSLSAMIGDQSQAMLHLSQMYYNVGVAHGILEGYTLLNVESIESMDEFDILMDFQERADRVVTQANA